MRLQQPRNLLPHNPSVIPLSLLRFQRLLKKQQSIRNPNREETRRDQIRQRIGEPLEQTRILNHLPRLHTQGIRQRPTDRRTENRPNVPHQRHNTKRPRLQLLKRHHLRHHGANNPYIPVSRASQTAGDDGHGERGAEPPQQAREHGAGEAEQDGGLAAVEVREPAPGDAHAGLAQAEHGGGEPGPFAHFAFGDGEGADHFGEVGEERGAGEGFGEAAYCCGNGLFSTCAVSMTWERECTCLPSMASCCLGSLRSR